MKSRASLILIALSSVPAAAQEPPVGEGPRGSSQVVAGEVRYDAVGYAGTADAPGVAAVTDAVAAGRYLEVTALDSGRTVVVAVIAGAPGGNAIVALSPAARAALGTTADRPAVRVRRVVPSPQDIALLRAGQAANPRSDAPEVLLVPLRRKLVAPPTGEPPTPALTLPIPATTPNPVPPKKPASVPAPRPATGTYVVQVAALSNAARAQALARQLGGTVTPAGTLFRVQIGPFADPAAADRARARAVAAGYPDARRQRVGTR